MKALYYDCFAGLSGDMNLGALIDLGVSLEYLKSELSKLGLDHEFELKVYKADKHGIFGTKVDVIDHHQHAHAEVDHSHDHENHGLEHANQGHEHGDHGHDHENHGHDHGDHGHDHGDHGHDHGDHEHDHENHRHAHGDHEHDHGHAHVHQRNYGDIKDIIQRSELNASVKNNSLKVFEIIAIAEAKIHGKSIDEVHFHEVGAIDSIVDVIGSAICLDALKVDTVMASTLEVGSGFVRCAHGLMPIPAPATAEILKGVPIKSDVKKFEMTTPTGAAILKAFVNVFTDEKQFKIDKVGYGLGTRDMDIPNLVRVMLVDLEDHALDHEKAEASKVTYDEDHNWIMETNIDDMSSELLVYAEEKLLKAGALDVYKTPIIMKKGRPAIKLTILAKFKDLEKLQKVVFGETTSIGMRMYPVEKVKIKRSYEMANSEFGPISMKKAYFKGELVNTKPEFEQMKKFALESGLSIKEVYNRVAQSADQKALDVKALRVTDPKFDQLCTQIEGYKKILVAFSGGVDSTFLMKVATDLLGANAAAVTVKSPYIADWEIAEAKELTEKYHMNHQIITVGIPEIIEFNPTDRCYLCKGQIFSTIKAFGKERGFDAVADGSNFDDTKDYRPGMRALKELEIQSPLLECGVTKAEIRNWSKLLGLETWDKPAYACLLTRLPYGTKIDVVDLKMIESAEAFIIGKGIRAVRVRKQGGLARIEIDRKELAKIFDLNLMDEIAMKLKEFGFEQVTVDLSGYQVGSFNKGVVQNEV